jgi:sulfur oxidation c-type cytochrome SoxX
MRLALAIASFVVLIVHGVVFYDQFFHRWERHQTAYFDQARALSKNDQERAELGARSPRIEQFIVTSFGDTRVDRCGTCHIAADDPRFTGHAQPLKTHSYSVAMGDVMRNGRWERRHKFSDFGCTVCHDGQGRGLDNHYSHGQDEFWPDPLLGYVAQEHWRKDFKAKLKGKEYLEVNCVQCHTEESFNGAPTVAKGRKLFYSMNCYGCHKIDGMSEGTLGPELTDVGKKWRVDYLWESIVEPRANIATSFMPKFKVNDDDVKALVVFLKSRKGMNFADTHLAKYRLALHPQPQVVPAVFNKVPPAAGAKAGEQLIKDRACTACHKLGEVDGGIAPDLTYEGLIRDDTWLMEHFKAPGSRIPDSIMPAFRFPEADYRQISDHLLGLKIQPPNMSAAATYKSLCARCHGEKGDAQGPVATYIDPAPRDFTKVSFMTSKPRQRFIDSISKGVPGTSMAPWGRALGEERVKGVLDYVLATYTKEKERPLKSRQVPAANPVAMSKESVSRGEKLFIDRCSGCHGKKADGKGPNSLDISPRPRNLRNYEFVDTVSDGRFFDSILYGVQGTAMPPWVDYGLSNNDVGDLVNFIRSLNPNSNKQGVQHARR